MKTQVFRRAVAAALALAIATPAHAGFDSISLHFDPDCTTCGIRVNPAAPFDLYIDAELRSSDGTTGAEFRVVGLPAEWLLVEFEPNPAATVVVGGPFTGGCNIAFNECQSPPNRCLHLFRAKIWPTTVRNNVHLRVDYVPRPYDCDATCCARLVACDPPIYTWSCVTAGEAWINGPDCTVGIASQRWGNVKMLYR